MPSPSVILNKLSSTGNELFLLTAPSGAGKTTWCLSFSASASSLGLGVAGLVSPAVFNNGEKTGIDLLDLQTGARKSLAVRSPQAINGLRWNFGDTTLQWGNEVLKQITVPQIFILDELGPLEFQRELGLTHGFEIIAARRYRLACVVVRPSLLPLAMERWSWAQILDLQAARP